MPIRFVSLVVVMFLCSIAILIFVVYLTRKYEAKAMKAKTARDAYAAKLMAELEEKKAAELEAGNIDQAEVKPEDDSAPVAQE